MKKTAKEWYVIIVGCGRLGSKVAGALSDRGENVVIIDLDKKNFEHLPPQFSGFQMEGDATSVDTLKEAKMEQANLVLALTDDDNTNFMVSQVAKEGFDVNLVISRVYDPDNLPLFEQFQIKTISPMELAHDALMSKIPHSPKEEA
ncbi:MAG TPA: TrkA family potassium uptake protein [Thermotogota bacterium]|nr:TrkA family potassium uptake protein [Thermotogota bacterium]HRW91700.1 TrkA family potassium uptake protein [Thermotogota bacterium]